MGKNRVKLDEKILLSDKCCPSSHSRQRSVFFTELSSKKISGAAFDVFREETADSYNKLLKLDIFVLTPHIAEWTHYSVGNIARIVTTNIERISQAQVPLMILNSELTY
jgi:D-3-phosphoglycerate dehydrogenase